MKKLLSLLLILSLLVLSFASCKKESGSVTPEAPDPADASDYAGRDVTGRNVAYVTMKIKNYGDVKLLLDATSAPRTVANFLTLAKSGFYDGLAFCEVLPLTQDATIILGGDAELNEREPAEDMIKGEFSANGIENDLELKRGTISMIYPGTDPDSASSVFFFSNGDLSSIYDGLFATFGYVISGFKIVDEIINLSLDHVNFSYLIAEDYRPVIESVTVDQDIDYSLVSDVYAQPLTKAEISSILGEGNDAKRVSVSSDQKSVYRVYVSNNKYLFQLFDKVDGSTANLLVIVDNNGKIIGTKALSTTKESTATQLPTLVGLDLATIDAAEISADLKAMVKEALSASVSVLPPSADEITDILGADHKAKQLAFTSAPVSLAYGYKNGEDYLFQMVSKSDSGLAIVLFNVTKDGKILGAKALPLTADVLAAQVPSLIGLDFASINAAEVSKDLKSIAIDAINTAIDLSIKAPTADELKEVIGEDNKVAQINTSYAPTTVLRSYTVGENYLFHMIGKGNNGLALILLHVSKSGTVLGVKALSMTSEALAAQVSSMVGLDLAGLNDAQLPETLKKLAKDAINTVSAILSNGLSSKYVFVRDIEGRETYTVEMKIKGYDTPILILLDKTTAPITVANFLSLVERGFYDGLDFHRIIKGFMIQGGASQNNHLPTIKGEFASNGHENDILHLRGTISMARTSVMDSATSQFFICDADASHLDGEYAAFGYVISGMETVDAIADYATGKTDSNGNLNAGVEKPTIEYIKLIEN